MRLFQSFFILSFFLYSLSLSLSRCLLFYTKQIQLSFTFKVGERIEQSTVSRWTWLIPTQIMSVVAPTNRHKQLLRCMGQEKSCSSSSYFISIMAWLTKVNTQNEFTLDAYEQCQQSFSFLNFFIMNWIPFSSELATLNWPFICWCSFRVTHFSFSFCFYFSWVLFQWPGEDTLLLAPWAINKLRWKLLFVNSCIRRFSLWLFSLFLSLLI